MEPIEEDGAETTIVKAQKLTEHEGHLRARDYDDVTQEFIVTAIGDYWAHQTRKSHICCLVMLLPVYRLLSMARNFAVSSRPRSAP